MATEVWIPMDEIQDQEPIWAGTKIRIYQGQPMEYLLSFNAKDLFDWSVQ
ncbi:hypothetical protein [Paenibacillus amylolyticus]